MFIILRSCNSDFPDRLMIIQTDSISVTDIDVFIIAVVYLCQPHRHQWAACFHCIMLHDHISVVVIHVHGACTSCFLAVICPVVLKAGVVYVGNVDSRTHIFIIAVTIWRKILCISWEFRAVSEQHTIIIPILIPVFHKPCDIKADIFLFISGKLTYIFNCFRIHRFIKPCNIGRIPVLKHTMNLKRSFFFIFRKRHHYQTSANYHISCFNNR